jgi:hypothetical protein
VWPLDGLPASMLDAIVSGLAMLRSTVPRSTALPGDIDLIAGEAPEGAVIAQTTRLLAAALIEEMVAADGRPSQLTGGMADELEALTRAAASFRVTAAQRRDALGDAAAIIREVGLEHHDLDCHLATDRDGRDVIVSAPIPSATAHVWLLDRLFQRAEVFVLGDEVLAYERMASAWYFSRWSVGGRGLDREAMAFTRNVREQEWSLVERETVTFDMPVMEALVHDERFAEIPARQQRLAHALLASVLDIFAVETVEQSHMTLRSVRGGRAHRVHEHNEEARMEPGYFVIGRLIPFENDLWLRSPGTVSYAARDADEATVLGDALTRVAGAMPLPIAIEALISTIVLGGKVPASPKPASSAAEARELVEFMTDALDELGLREEVAVEELPDDMAARLTPGSRYYRYAADEALAEWIAALGAQAERGAGSAAGAKRQGGKKGKKKRRR